MATTLAITDTEITDSLTRAVKDANRVLVENERLLTNNLTVYYATQANWSATGPPPPIVLKNGRVQTSGYTVSESLGSVTFSTALASGDVVTATFICTPYTASDLQGFVRDALYAVEAKLATCLDETAFPRYLKDSVVTCALIMVLRGLQAGTAENYKYTIGGQTVDKNAVTAHFDQIIRRQTIHLNEMVAFSRPRFMAEGRVVALNIDMGRPPTQYSQYRPEGYLP